MCNKAFCFSPVQFVSDWCKTQETSIKDVGTCPFVFDSVPNQYKNQEICEKVVSEDSFMLKYCLDIYKTQ